MLLNLELFEKHSKNCKCLFQKIQKILKILNNFKFCFYTFSDAFFALFSKVNGRTLKYKLLHLT